VREEAAQPHRVVHLGRLRDQNVEESAA
jgi:hypothetical protein